MTIKCDVLIVGGGVTGTALAYVLSRFTSVEKVVLIEKNSGVAQVNSHPLNNSQTSHDGGTETNYNLEHALKVKQAATYLRHYVESTGDENLFRKTKRMVLAVGSDEVRKLQERFAEFAPHYPDLHYADRQELAQIETAVVLGRDPNQPIAALVSNEGYAVNYQRLSEHFLEDAHENNKTFEHFFDTELVTIERSDEHGWIVSARRFPQTQNAVETIFEAKVVVFAAGPYSLLFAQRLGYGLDYGILPVAGSFYSAGHMLDNKVYRMQVEGRPFAEIHGDPDVLNANDTRFGPTTKPLPLMERHHYNTFWDFLKLPMVTFRGVKSLVKVIRQNRLALYVAKNMLYDLPVIGKALFLREVRMIVPRAKFSDLKLRRGVGGIRPQIVDLTTGTLQMGDASIVGDNVIFNTTPSPGASVCLANAKRDAERIVQMLGEKIEFDAEKFGKELEQQPSSR